MVKFTSSLLLASLLAIPALGQIQWDDLDTREVAETEIFGREITDAEYDLFLRGIGARGVAASFRRELIDDEDLSARQYADEGELFEREYDEELDARDVGQAGIFDTSMFSFMKYGMRHFKQVAHEGEAPTNSPTQDVASSDASPPALSERDFIDEEDLYERGLDLDFELAERDFDEELEVRDFEEVMEEREYYDEDLFEREYHIEDLD